MCEFKAMYVVISNPPQHSWIPGFHRSGPSSDIIMDRLAKDNLGDLT